MNKLDQLQATVLAIDPDVIGITESWCHSDIASSELALEGYDLFRCDRPISTKGGGVLLYVKEELHAVECELESLYPEHVWCNISYAKGNELLVGVCYRTPTDKLYDDLHGQLIALITEVSNKNFLLMGDFNYKGIDWINHTTVGTDCHELAFSECLEDSMLTQHVMDHTTDKSLLDLIITKEPDLVTDLADLGKFASSDHHILTWNVNINVSKSSVDHVSFNYNKMDITAIRSELSSVDWNKLLCGTVEDDWLVFKRILDEMRLRYVPYGKRCSSSKKLWMTHGAVKAVRRKYKTYRRYKNSHHPAYVKAERKARYLVKQAKLNFEKKLAESIKKDTKSFFAYVRSKSKAQVRVGPLKDSGHVIADSKSMAEIFNDYFASVFTVEDTSSVPVDVETDVSTVMFTDVNITEDIVKCKLDTIRDDKAAGPDELLPRFLAAVKDEICKPVCMIFNKSLKECSVPLDWKDANVTPLFKSGQKNSAFNYRPVSLTCQLCKVMESILRDEMVHHLETNGLINDSQHGFRKGRSCLTNILSFLDRVTEMTDIGYSMDAIYLDFAKAFDKVPHHRLLMKLRRHGIGGSVLAWIEEWLKERRQRVCIKGAHSGWKSVLSGVPQGSVLGPVLFLVFINDLDTGIDSMVFKFADDTKLLSVANDVIDCESLQKDLNTLVSWSRDWQMQFNVDKCKVMHFGHKNGNFEYYMDRNALKSVFSEKDLGIEVASDLKSTTQCVAACKKANRMLGMVYRHIVNKTPDIMLRLYKTLVRPHVEYCVSAWSPCYRKDKELIERVQHRFTRMVHSMSHLEYGERLRRLNLWTLEERRNRADLIEVFKIYTGLTMVRLTDFFTLNSGIKGTRGHTAKLVKVRCEKNTRKHFFSLRVIDRWNALDEETVAAPSVGAFKSRLNKIRSTRMGFFLDRSDKP